MRWTVASLLLLTACANAPRQEEGAPPLVIPPLDADAGGLRAAPSSRVEVPSPLAVPARDPRPSMRTPRSAVELESEIATLERDSTASAMHQLADDYCELARAERSRDARERAIAKYEELTTRFPSYAALDEAFYYLGLEEEILGDKTRARRAYFELIKRKPDSDLVPYAYFAFAEMFFAESASDPSKVVFAEQAYREVLKHPTTPLVDEAKKRLAELKAR